MPKATFSVLSEKDKQLVLETEYRQLRKLDEDELLELHARVRRARNKHSKLYRREAAAHVGRDRARGMASKKTRRVAARAEVLEEALARVSRRLSSVAASSAEKLKKERIEVARRARRSSKGSGKGRPGAMKAPAGSGSSKRKRHTPSTKKARASTKASGARRQAKRDSR